MPKDDPEYSDDDPIHKETSTLGPEKLCGMVIMHVDDMLGAGCPRSPRYKAVTDMLRSTFSFREWKEDNDKLENWSALLRAADAYIRKTTSAR